MARPLTRRRAARAALALVLLAACASAPPAPPAPADASFAPVHLHADEVPRTVAPAVLRAEAAIRTLRDRLLARQAAELAAEGSRRAIAVFHEEFPALAAAVSAQTGVDVGRTSARPRAESNAPRPWAAPLVAEASGRRAADVAPAIVDLGDRVAVLRPIAATSSCLGCHGAPERLAPEVKGALDALYPGDAATGLAEGDLVGFFWAEARK